MSILARIHAQGGEVIRDQWRFSLRRGRLTDAAVAWLRSRWRHVCAEAWPDYDRWAERAAIKEFMGGMDRATAEAEAYSEVMAHV